MKSMMRIAVYPASGLVLFLLSLVIILAIRGKLNAEVMQRLRIVGSAANRQQETDEDESVPTVATMRYFSSEELTDMLKEARTTKEKAEAEAAKLSQREKRVALLIKDLQKEKQELLKMRGEADVRLEELKKAEAEISKRTIEIEKAEAAGLRRSAAIHEAMDAKKAAAAIATLDLTQGAKLLSFIQEKKAARILQEMTPEGASALLSLVKKVSADTGKEND